MTYDKELADRIQIILQEAPGIVEKKMFGGIGYLANGNMACGINGEQLIVRISAADYGEALKQPHVHVFDMTGQPLKGWITVDPAGYPSEAELRAWIERGLQHALSLPPK
jgi:TfoX/Sxy family transcriptional regulator of competence genes